MSVFTSYPGVYIQELPSNAHTIAPAPTSVTVFVGYSHPFKTNEFNTPVELFSFADYEREFGGFFQSGVIDNNLPYAVSQFFLNGGTDAVVVGLNPSTYYDETTSPPTKKGTVSPGQVNVPSASPGIAFTALEPTDIAATSTSPGTVMSISVGNVNSSLLNGLTLTAGGAGSNAGYHSGDVLTLTGGTGGEVTVGAVDGGGGILTWTLTTAGSGYAKGIATVTGGNGAGAQFNISATDPNNKNGLLNSLILTVGGPGSNAHYKAGDVLTIDGGNGGRVTVGTVDGGGGILTWSLTSAGTGYTTGAGVGVTGGSGAGAQFNIATILAVADVTITYASQQEVYRKVTLGNASDPNYIETRIGTKTNRVSSLVTVGPNTNYPGGFTATTTPAVIAAVAPANTTGVFSAGDYTAAFQTDSLLDKWPVFNLLVTSGVPNSSNTAIFNDSQVVMSEALAFCERKLAFYIMDPPSAPESSAPNSSGIYVADSAPTHAGWVAIDSTVPNWPVSPNGAIYFPYIQSNDPNSGLQVNLPPSGTVAGIFAREDTNRGVWKAPAGLETTILNTTGVVPSGVMTDPRQGVLNNDGINCLRTFPGVGTVVFGARTLVYTNPALQTQWGYVPVRRMALFIEQTLKASLVWAVFEPNDQPLWTALRVTVESFMMALFNQGAFAGSTPSQAFQVVCDSTTTTPDDVNLGRVNIIVGFAPLKPAEFVIVKITQLAGQPQS